ncbi:MAG: STAS domain-containing protein [Pseudohongiellaceae bacterium]
MSEQDDLLTVKIGPSLTLKNVAAFYEELAEVKDREVTKLVFDSALNEEIDFAGTQTLAAFYEHMTSRGTKISWDNPSIAIFEKTVELGMDEALGL